MKSDHYFVEDIPRRDFLKTTLKGGMAVAATPTLMSSLMSCSGSEQPDVKNSAPRIFSPAVRKQ